MKPSQLALWVPPAVGFAVWAGLTLLVDPSFSDYYARNMRAPLFTGMFTLSGFLLSAKTFVVLNMKKEMYQTDAYLRRVRDARKLTGNAGYEAYAPLRRLGTVLLWNVIACLLASVSQFTFGITGIPSVVAIAPATAAAAVGMMAVSLAFIARNLNDMYTHFEAEANDRIAAVEAREAAG